jgi:hypothetical protein
LGFGFAFFAWFIEALQMANAAPLALPWAITSLTHLSNFVGMVEIVFFTHAKNKKFNVGIL